MSVNTVVIDIEDMALAPNAVILSVGAIAFDLNDVSSAGYIMKELAPVHPHVRYNSLYLLVDSFDQIMMGRFVSPSTQNWWKKQRDAQGALKGDKDKLGHTLDNLSAWFTNLNVSTVYFRGPDHDGAILENAYDMCGIKSPWKYNQKRDTRTFIDVAAGTSEGYLSDYKASFNATKHNALHDAAMDAEQMCIAQAKMKGAL